MLKEMDYERRRKRARKNKEYFKICPSGASKKEEDCMALDPYETQRKIEEKYERKARFAPHKEKNYLRYRGLVEKKIKVLKEIEKLLGVKLGNGFYNVGKKDIVFLRDAVKNKLKGA